ncbi:MAG: 4-amino-4-deoxy-L-arabinose transferase [Gimesia sp.]|nr:4-amino-4-deoxy-L-arabinose transferase [Gimesia sp.]
MEDNNTILSSKRETNWYRWSLVVIILLFLIWRVPLVMREAGGQDEEWFAIPGSTIWQEGIPRVPFVPQRNRESAFYNVDKALFALPPLFYYASAPLYAVLPPTYSTTRLVSITAGVGAIILIYLLAWRILNDPLAGVIGTGLFSLSRLLFFPAMISRPDMLCGMWGLAALWMMWRWYDNEKRYRDLILAGICLGLGMLTHPFAIVFCIQVGLWAVLTQGTWRERFSRGTVITGCALAIFALWLPLIFAYPETFRLQFSNNVLDRSGPGLISRLLFPWPYFPIQLGLLREYAGTIQLTLMTGGLLAGTWLAWRSVDRRPRILIYLSWSSIYLLIACQGSHPTKGYWCYPGALLFLCLGWGLSRLGRNFWEHSLTWRVAAVSGALFFVAAMFPGSGIRTWVAHMQNWSNVNYSGPRFAQQIIDDIPPDARVTVDRAFVYNFSAAGRKTLLSMMREFYFDARNFPYDYLVVSYDSQERDTSQAFNGRLIATYGDPHDPFSCYAEVYVPQDSPVQELHKSRDKQIGIK